MSKRLFTTLFLALLLPALLLAQSSNLKEQEQRMQKVDPSIERAITTPSNFSSTLSKTNASQLFFTEYDYAGNNTIPNMLDMNDLDGDGDWDVFGVGMQRFIANQTRSVQFFADDDGAFINFAASDPTLTTGWGTLQIVPALTKALIMGHQGGNSMWLNVDLGTFTADGPVLVTAGNFPSFVYLANGTMFVTNTNGQLFSSTDLGVTLTDLGTLDAPDATGYQSEYILKKSPNDMYIVHPTMFAFVGNGGPGGVPDDSTDWVALNYSTDMGATWTLNEIIGRDGITPVANRPGYWPIFENFGQINGVADNNGVFHVTVNGYSYWDRGTDTTFAYAALYWNSRDRQWLSMSDESAEGVDYTDASPYTYPGNGLGNAYPIISIDESGTRMVAMWQGPEFSAPGVVNTWAVTVDDPVAIHYTDLYYNYSNDGGQTWGTAALVPGASEAGVQESYPYLNQWLETDGDNVTVHYLYFVDAIPGTSLFDDNNSASDDSYWAYDNFSMTLTDVKGNDVTISSYALEQNYPNPFNPSTTIKYSVPESGLVTLKVYDVLGKEVATIINEVVNAGQHSVNFNADNLTSGIYFYEISAGDFVKTNKMMLLK
jgi:hypothetical protein